MVVVVAPRSLTRIVFLALLTIACTLPAGATQLAPMTLRDTVRASGPIVLGTVVSKTSRWNVSHRWMRTDVVFNVEELVVPDAAAPDAGKNVTLSYWGGTIDGETQAVAELRVPAPGERLLLMLRPDWRRDDAFAPTVGMNHGFFRVAATTPGAAPVVIDAANRPLALGAGGTIERRPMIGSGDAPVGVDTMLRWLRSNAAAIKAEPPPAKIRRVENAMPLVAKRAAEDGAAPPREVAPPLVEMVTPPRPASPDAASSKLSRLRSVARAAELKPSPSYVTNAPAYAPITFDQLPSSFSPWSPEDQYQMSKWNSYADIFRVYATPTTTFAWHDGVFDIDGFISSSTLYSQYGASWDANTIAVTFTDYDFWGYIVEADIAFNPAFTYTLNDEIVYDGSSAVPFRQAMTHELGHALGLDHEFWDMSVMNYFPSEFRFVGFPYRDDANGARDLYYARSKFITDLGIYLFTAPDYQYAVDASYPSSVTAGGLLSVNDYQVENAGWYDVSQPSVDWYLTSARNYSSSYYYLGTATYSYLSSGYSFYTNTVGVTLTVPADVPPGYYYLAAFIGSDGGPTQSSFPFSNSYAFSRNLIHITGGACSYSVNTGSVPVGVSGRTGWLEVSGSPSVCSGSWTASSDSTSWLILTGATSGSGSTLTNVTFNALPNNGGPRTGHINFSFGKSVSFVQDGTSSCTYTLTPTSAAVPFSSGSGAVAVNGSPGGCSGSWSATPSSSGNWLGLSGTTFGSGSGSWSVPYFYSTNGSSFSSRSGAIVFSGPFIQTNAFSVTQGPSPAGGMRHAAALGDFNGDGRADVLWHIDSSGLNAMWLMNGTTKTLGSYIESASTNWSVAGVGDFNGDLRADILWRDESSGANAMWLMNGTTKLLGSYLESAPTNWKVAGVGDFNHDGRADIFWRDPGSGANAIWLMNGTTKAVGALVESAAASWSVAGIGDVDGNGTADIFWRDTGGNDAVWLMSGTTKSFGAFTDFSPLPWRVVP